MYPIGWNQEHLVYHGMGANTMKIIDIVLWALPAVFCTPKA